MDAEREPARARAPRRGTARAGVAFGAVGLLLAGCASMPDSGEVREVRASQGVDSQVRVFGVPPADKASPTDIVDGFLEAMTSDDPQLETARKYLTDDAAKNWKPGSSVTVLSAGLDRFPVQGDKESEGHRWKVTGKKLATVDERSAYQPETGGGRYEEYLQLVKFKDQWRIATPPSTLVLSESDFQRIYKPVNKYYFGDGTLVNDPVYVRQRSDPDSRMDPTTQTVQSLLAGPSKWLGPVVTTSFLTGTELAPGTKSLSLDGQNTLRVPLKLDNKAAHVPQSQCQKMATQLLYTIKDLTASRLDRVELQRADGKTTLCWVTRASAAPLANRVPSQVHQYYVDKDFRLVQMSLNVAAEEQQPQEKPELVPGPLAAATTFKVGSAAVTYDEKRAAVVSEDGRGLYVVNMTTAGPMPQALLTSKGRLSAPSWDAHGDLWVADLDPQNQGLWRVPGGTGTPQKVDVAGLDDGKIAGLKASPDGVRIALLVQKNDDRKNLYIGRIERPERKGDVSPVSVRELRPAAPQMADVMAMSWAPRGRLLVVGKESGGITQARYMLADGSMVAASLPGAAGLTGIGAYEDEAQPVVASSDEDGIVWLPPGAQWRTVAAGGRAPVYPG
ncbi:LpqB family beta-propeller domain-containing protein [Streptomyces sp. NPDC051577]|uniref:LpqB family beta-propeller domain-containing protein n=1 Tax=Streptomyces sp. NPDC051577 TaxID=3155166 RepID=UPI003431986E